MSHIKSWVALSLLALILPGCGHSHTKKCCRKHQCHTHQVVEQPAPVVHSYRCHGDHCQADHADHVVVDGPVIVETDTTIRTPNNKDVVVRKTERTLERVSGPVSVDIEWDEEDLK